MIFVTDNGKEIEFPNELTYTEIEKFSQEVYKQGKYDGFNECRNNGYEVAFENGRKEVRADIAKECRYLLACGMGKKKSLEHLIKILEKEQK